MSLQKLGKNSSEEGFNVMLNEVDHLFENFNSQQISLLKQSVNAYLEGGTLDLDQFERVQMFPTDNVALATTHPLFKNNNLFYILYIEMR